MVQREDNHRCTESNTWRTFVDATLFVTGQETYGTPGSGGGGRCYAAGVRYTAEATDKQTSVSEMIRKLPLVKA